MLSLTLKSIKAKKLRFVLTSVAVMLGVAFMAGTLVLTDTIKQNYDELATNVYRDTDAVVRSAHTVKDINGKTERGTIDANVLATVRRADGVRAAEAQQLGIAVVVGHDGELVDASPNRSAPIATGWQKSPELNPMDVVDGHTPVAADDIVIDRATQQKGNFVVGERVKVLGQSGAHEYTLAGVVTYAGEDSAAGAQVVAFTPDTASQVFGTPGKYAAIQVVAEPGVSQSELATNIRAVVTDPAVDVVTAAAATDEVIEETGTALKFVNIFLLTFAIVALVVGSFVIYNTFSITVAQRTKETALLRAIGAKRRQVMRSVMLEAWFTGLFASAIGVVAGLGLARGLSALLDAFGMTLPTGGTVVNTSTIVVSLVVGVVVTVVAAYVPARKAAKVAPIEALRDAEASVRTGSKRRTVAGVLVTLAGAFMIAQGIGGAGASAVGLGAFGVFFGIAMVGPVIAGRFTRVFGAPLPRVRGMAGTLAKENAARNPKRTSATASALMIGVGLVTLITIFAASARASIADTIESGMVGQYAVNTTFGMGGLSPEAARQIDALPETDAVTQFRWVNATIDGTSDEVSAVDPATVERTLRMNVTKGDLAQLGTHEVAVHEDEAKKRNIAIGDTVTLTFPETGAQQMTVVAEYGTFDPFGPYAMSIAAQEANFASHVDNMLFIRNAEGVSMEQARHAIEGVLDDYPTAKLLTKDEFIGEISGQINQMLNLVYVLLAMALVIAFFGIANTLALSVYERTRELGLLRAVGMSRGQLRSTVRWESVLTALLGTTLGIAIGLGFSVALVQAMEGDGLHTFAVPASELGAIAVFAAVAAVIAAALPARRAAKLDVLQAISN